MVQDEISYTDYVTHFCRFFLSYDDERELDGILYLLDRKLMEPLVTTLLGWAAIFTVLVLETIGYLVIRKIVTVEI